MAPHSQHNELEEKEKEESAMAKQYLEGQQGCTSTIVEIFQREGSNHEEDPLAEWEEGERQKSPNQPRLFKMKGNLVIIVKYKKKKKSHSVYNNR